MKQILFLIPILLTASAARPKEKKATVEDVERSYITTKARLSPPPPLKPKSPAKSPTQFGFVPVKTATNYAQKEPKIIYAQPEYLANHQGRSQYNTIAYSSPQQYSTGAQQQASAVPVAQYSSASPVPLQQYSTGAQQHASEVPLAQYSSASPVPLQQYSTGAQQQASAVPVAQYSSASSVPHQQYSTGINYSPRSQYTEAVQKQKDQPQAYYIPQVQHGHYLSNYDNLQYVGDNNVDQGSQQYYNPQQFYYLQQYQAPSTSIQAVVDPKGGLQYIMYIPTYVPSQNGEQTQNYENAAYTNNDQTYQQTETPFIEKQTSYEIGKSAHTPKGEFASNREPKSLLDSYVPSSLQLQYYKQAQAQLNSLRDSQKYAYSSTGAEPSHHIPFNR